MVSARSFAGEVSAEAVAVARVFLRNVRLRILLLPCSVLGECQFDCFADGAALGAEAVGLEARLDGFDDGAHLFGAGFLTVGLGEGGDNLADEGAQVFFGEGFGQELLDDAISTASLAASSGRSPLVNCSMESRRCLIMVARICWDSASVRPWSEPTRFSMALFLRAVVMRRSVVVRSPSRPSWR